MLRLTAAYSEALAKLIDTNDAPIDGIEVGTWFTPEKIKEFQRKLPEWQFQFHASSIVARYQFQRGILKRLLKYLECTQSQWVSLHLELLPPHVFLLSSRFGVNLPPPNAEQAKNKFVRLLSKVKKSVAVPVILENLASLPAEKYAYAASPSAIKEIVETTDCGFLLDIPHALSAASYQGMRVETYLENLPLEKVVQIHVSGPREKDGYLRDAHESMQDKDYAILEWVLQRTKPEVVTLEYFRERELLREQLWKLRDLVAG